MRTNLSRYRAKHRVDAADPYDVDHDGDALSWKENEDLCEDDDTLRWLDGFRRREHVEEEVWLQRQLESGF